MSFWRAITTAENYLATVITFRLVLSRNTMFLFRLMLENKLQKINNNYFKRQTAGQLPAQAELTYMQGRIT